MRFDIFTLRMKMYQNLLDTKMEIEDEIDFLCYHYCGVKAISYDRETIISTHKPDEKLMILSEKLEQPQRELDFVNNAIKQIKPLVDECLDKLPDDIKRATQMLFFEKMTYRDVGKAFGYTDNGMWHKIRREVEKI